MATEPIYRIVLTGGPCGGKTTSTAHITERLEALGFKVFVVPEAATLLATGGIDLYGLSEEDLIRVETNVLRLIFSLEDAFVDLARCSNKPTVILCDRGTMDVSAYMPAPSFHAMLDEHSWTLVGLRDRRYEAVIHLVTAADGAEDFYTTENNVARTEPPEVARDLDRKVLDAWVGHPHLRVIDNSTDFAGKIRRVVGSVCRMVGVPEPEEKERKFLVRAAPELREMPVRCEEFEIEQTYLQSPQGVESRVRRRGQRGSFSYNQTTKKPRSETGGQRIEIERQISAREFLALLDQGDPTRQTVRKRRRCFVWNQHYFELDTFVSPQPGLMLLEAEMDPGQTRLDLPPFIEIEREVTGNRAFYNAEIALLPDPGP